LDLTAFTSVVVADKLPGIESLRSDIVRVALIDRVAPGILALIRAAGGLLPFGLGRQPIFLAGLRAQPVAVRDGRIPVHSKDGIVVTVGRAAAMIVRLGPIWNLGLRNNATTRPVLGIVITWVVAKLPPLAVRDFVLAHVKGVKI